jgi:hypothetical protein
LAPWTRVATPSLPSVKLKLNSVVKSCACAGWVVMTASTSTAANASAALAAVRHTLEIQFRCCGVVFI